MFAILASVVQAAVDKDRITSLPGWSGALPTKHYSGYLDISSTKHLHYWFVESENKPATDPVVLWLNGGPGCSSLDGFIYEHGPFRLSDDAQTLVPFPQAWNKIANMLYLEAPVGVGFSYSDNSADYRTDDDKTANDNLAAIQKFYSLFPEYKSNNLFLTGESYAGIYVPTLAEAILNAQKNGSYTGAPLVGIAVGNGCTGNELGVCGPDDERFRGQYLARQAFLPSALRTEIEATCDFSARPTTKCSTLLRQMENGIGNINIYNIYGECISGSAEELYGRNHSKIGSNHFNLRLGGQGPNACIDSIGASTYLNRADVQAAIHVKKPAFRWAVCGNSITYSRSRKNLPRDTYPALIANYRVLIFAGDWDACVPYTDNEAWTSGMKLATKSAWHPWTYGNQVGGYATVYANDFTFTTVRGGRHEVPETAPLRALEMFRRFINKESF